MSRTTLWRRMRALGLLAALTILFGCGCGGSARFALRDPVLRDSDDRLLAHAPKKDDESDLANSLDVILFGPLSRGLAFRSSGEAHNVSSIDEVPDSTWFTNRTVRPEQLERGICPDAGAVLPLTIKSSKVGGTTPGFVVKDALDQPFMAKIDEVLPRQPEISTAADAIVSRLYWAVGFNVPCNDVVYIDPDQLVLRATSYETLATGERVPLKASRLAEMLGPTTRNAKGQLRISTSRFIEGEPIGTWRTEGTRADDPNDVIPHEDRRELRGEYFLAAWTGHWDSRGLNSFDTFVRPKGASGGYVRHYFLDFSEAIGGMPMRTKYQETRTGFVSVSNVPVVLEDVFAFGLARRAWDDVVVDPQYPNLGYFGVGHFDPFGFSSQTPLVRWIRAERTDLAWMARKLARLDIEHVRVAVRSGRLSNPAEETRLVEILMGRRERVLRASFKDVSPLADIAVEKSQICATDLGITTKLSRPESVSYSPAALRSGDRICFPLPSSTGYGTVDLIRNESGHKTLLRAHLYWRGSERGFALVGIERL